MQCKNKHFSFHSLVAFHGSLAAATVFTKLNCITVFVNLMILGLSIFLAAKLPFKCRVCYVFMGPKRSFKIKVLESNRTSQFYNSQNCQVINICRSLVGTLSQQEASHTCFLPNPHQNSALKQGKREQAETFTLLHVSLRWDQKSHDWLESKSLFFVIIIRGRILEEGC